MFREKRLSGGGMEDKRKRVRGGMKEEKVMDRKIGVGVD
jgi:hypothetical protein